MPYSDHRDDAILTMVVPAAAGQQGTSLRPRRVAGSVVGFWALVVDVTTHFPPLAGVAQLVEQLIRNQQVTSSSLVAGSSFPSHLSEALREGEACPS